MSDRPTFFDVMRSGFRAADAFEWMHVYLDHGLLRDGLRFRRALRKVRFWNLYLETALSTLTEDPTPPPRVRRCIRTLEKARKRTSEGEWTSASALAEEETAP